MANECCPAGVGTGVGVGVTVAVGAGVGVCGSVGELEQPAAMSTATIPNTWNVFMVLILAE